MRSRGKGNEMTALAETADRQSLWSSTAGVLKRRVEIARRVTSAFSILGALFAAIASQMANVGDVNALAAEQWSDFVPPSRLVFGPRMYDNVLITYQSISHGPSSSPATRAPCSHCRTEASAH
jgi:hypothetical protein